MLMGLVVVKRRSQARDSRSSRRREGGEDATRGDDALICSINMKNENAAAPSLRPKARVAPPPSPCLWWLVVHVCGWGCVSGCWNAFTQSKMKRTAAGPPPPSSTPSPKAVCGLPYGLSSTPPTHTPSPSSFTPARWLGTSGCKTATFALLIPPSLPPSHTHRQPSSPSPKKAKETDNDGLPSSLLLLLLLLRPSHDTRPPKTKQKKTFPPPPPAQCPPPPPPPPPPPRPPPHPHPRLNGLVARGHFLGQGRKPRRSSQGSHQPAASPSRPGPSEARVVLSFD